MTWMGTSHFVSKTAAINYYKSYGNDTEEVNRKLRDGELQIGRPKSLPGRATRVDEDGRWHVEMKESHE